MTPRRIFLGAVFALLSAPLAWADMALVMVEETGCVWCKRWNEEISPIYPKTDEGRAAPLRRIDIHAPEPDDLTFARGLHFTPTFVLMRDGVELSRIEGYPGEDFFWGLLAEMLADAGTPITN